MPRQRVRYLQYVVDWLRRQASLSVGTIGASPEKEPRCSIGCFILDAITLLQVN